MDEYNSDSRTCGAEAAAWQERVFGQNLRRRREELGISQRDLAERMQRWGHNWHQGTVRRTETGERPARVGELMTLAGILEVGLIDLLITEREAEADAVQRDINALLSQIGTIRRRSKEAQVAEARATEMLAIAETQEAHARNELEKARAMAAEANEARQYALGRLAEYSATLDLLQSKLARLADIPRPGDLVNVTLDNVAESKIVTDVDGRFRHELANKDGQVVLRSKPFPSEEAAKAAEEAFWKSDKVEIKAKRMSAPSTESTEWGDLQA